MAERKYEKFFIKAKDPWVKHGPGPTQVVLDDFVIQGSNFYWALIMPEMLTIGLGLIVWSLFADNRLLSGALGITGTTLLWRILELFKQKDRVEKGLFPKNPGRKD